MGRKGMAQAVCCKFSFSEASLFHGLAHGHLHGSIAEGESGLSAFKEIGLGFVLFVICIQVGQQGLGQDGEAVFVSLALDHLDFPVF